ncbi:MAG: putative PEP-binding protein, partial [Pseudomonadota bacterium]
LLATRQRLERLGYTMPQSMRVGAMLETPSLAYASDRFFGDVDFLSVGGNDLMQFFFAADRGNERVRRRYDALSSSFLLFLRDIVARADAAGTPISFCGEAAGRPEEAAAFAAIGFRSLSMRPASVGRVKFALRSVELSAVSALVDAALSEGTNVREALTAYLTKEAYAAE